MKKKLRTLLATGMIALGLMVGAPMRPDEIQELLHQINQPKIVHVLKDEADQDDTKD